MHCLNIPPKLANGSLGTVVRFIRPEGVSSQSVLYFEKRARSGVSYTNPGELPVVLWNQTPESPRFTTGTSASVHQCCTTVWFIQNRSLEKIYEYDARRSF